MEQEIAQRLDRVEKRLNVAIVYICVTLIWTIAGPIADTQHALPYHQYIVPLAAGVLGAFLAAMVIKMTGGTPKQKT